MRSLLSGGLAVAACFLMQASVIHAAEEASSAGHQLRVALYERPPFTFKDKSGRWTGLSIDLWERIAARIGVSYTYAEMPLENVLEELKSGKADLSPAISLSADQAKILDFTEPYLFSHGAVVTLHKSLLQSLGSFHGIVFNNKVLIIFMAMLLGMLSFSLLLVIAERKHALGHFSGPVHKRMGSAMWFSAVTMTTVGYGDKTPLSALGRLITFFWMLAGVLIIALFTGTVASDITRAESREQIANFGDLTRFRNGCIEGGQMDDLLRNLGIPAVRYLTVKEARQGFDDGRITAFAGDMVSLEYLMNQEGMRKLELFSLPDSALYYTFAVRKGLPELPRINRELLDISLRADWRSNAERWTGPLNL